MPESRYNRSCRKRTMSSGDDPLKTGEPTAKRTPSRSMPKNTKGTATPLIATMFCSSPPAATPTSLRTRRTSQRTAAKQTMSSVQSSHTPRTNNSVASGSPEIVPGAKRRNSSKEPQKIESSPQLRKSPRLSARTVQMTVSSASNGSNKEGTAVQRVVSMPEVTFDTRQSPDQCLNTSKQKKQRHSSGQKTDSQTLAEGELKDISHPSPAKKPCDTAQDIVPEICKPSEELDCNVEETTSSTMLLSSNVEASEPRKAKARRRESKRRSSFVRGRTLNKAMPASDSELMSLVPADLPEVERLAQLMPIALEFSLNKLEEDFGETDSFQQLKVELREAGKKTIMELKTGGLHDQATSMERFQPNPTNVAMDQALVELKAYTEKMDAEASAWDSLEEWNKKIAESAKIVLDEVESHPITERPKGLSVEQRKFLDSKPDFNAALRNLQHMKERAVIGAKKTLSLVRTFQRFGETAGTMLSELKQNIHSKSFEGMQHLFKEPLLLLKNIQDSQ